MTKRVLVESSFSRRSVFHSRYKSRSFASKAEQHRESRKKVLFILGWKNQGSEISFEIV
jgi:hypothetical protein